MATAAPPADTAARIEALLEHPERVGVVYRPIVDLRSAAVREYAAVALLPSVPAGAPPVPAGVVEAQVVQSALVVRPLLVRGRLVRVSLSAEALLSDPVWSALTTEPTLDHLVVEIPAGASCPALPTAVGELRARGARIALDLTGRGPDELACAAALGVQSVRAGAGDDVRAVFSALSALALAHEPMLVVDGLDTDDDLDAAMACGVRFGEGAAVGAAAGVPGELAHDVRAQLLRRAPQLSLGALAAPGPICTSSVLCLPAATSLRDAARRAMARPPAMRFDPVGVIDADGGHLGLVAVDRLVSALVA